MTQEMPPDSRRPLDTYYDEDMGRLQTYSMEVRFRLALKIFVFTLTQAYQKETFQLAFFYNYR